MKYAVSFVLAFAFAEFALSQGRRTQPPGPTPPVPYRSLDQRVSVDATTSGGNTLTITVTPPTPCKAINPVGIIRDFHIRFPRGTTPVGLPSGPVGPDYSGGEGPRGWSSAVSTNGMDHDQVGVSWGAGPDGQSLQSCRPYTFTLTVPYGVHAGPAIGATWLTTRDGRVRIPPDDLPPDGNPGETEGPVIDGGPLVDRFGHFVPVPVRTVRTEHDRYLLDRRPPIWVAFTAEGSDPGATYRVVTSMTRDDSKLFGIDETATPPSRWRLVCEGETGWIAGDGQGAFSLAIDGEAMSGEVFYAVVVVESADGSGWDSYTWPPVEIEIVGE